MIQLRAPAAAPAPVTSEPLTAAAAPAGAAQAGDAALGSSWLEIDLDRLAHNARSLRRRIQAPRTTPHTPARLCGVIKKNAYGLGAVPVARALIEAGCDMLAVYAPEEAEPLIADAIDAPLLLLSPLRTLGRDEALHRLAVEGKLHLTAHDLDHLRQLDALGRRLNLRLPVHLLVDTGMCRSGLSEAELDAVLETLPTLRYVRCVGICSHLACADEDAAFTEQQRLRFESLAARAEAALPHGVVRHLANTFATLRDPALHLDMVRCGLGLLGYGCESMRGLPESVTMPPLRPVLRWLSGLIHLQRYPAGACVGYGGTHTLTRDSVLGVVPVGYGDGYPLPLGNRAAVRLLDANDQPFAECPVLGRVNMDQLVIDLTDAPPSAEEIDALMGCRVELIASDPGAVDALPRLADLAGLHAHAMLCQLAPHLPRRYRGERHAEGLSARA